MREPDVFLGRRGACSLATPPTGHSALVEPRLLSLDKCLVRRSWAEILACACRNRNEVRNREHDDNPMTPAAVKNGPGKIIALDVRVPHKSWTL